MIRINVEHFVAGSPLNERGDGTLSYTAGVSPMAEQLAALFADKLPIDHALFFALVNPDTNLFTIMHAQGDYTRFEGQGRAYNTRIVYELTREAHATSGLDRRLTPLVAALDKMRPYDTRVFGQPNDLTIDETIGSAPLSLDEQLLHDVLIHAVVNNLQLYIHLGESDKQTGDNVRKSPKLQALLHAIDALPQGIRGYVSLGFSLEAATPVSQTLADHLLVIAHHDDIDDWGDATRACIQVDWQENKLNLIQGTMATATERERIKQVAPLIEPFLDTAKASRNTVMGMMQLIPENVDRILHSKKQPTDNDVRIIQAVYDTNTSDTYRRQDATEKLLQWMLNGVSCKVSMIDIWKKFPQLRKLVLSFLSTNATVARSFDKLATLHAEYAQEIPDVTDIIRDRILSSTTLMDDAAKHSDIPLAQAMQPHVAQKAKTWSMADKLKRLDIPYYGLTQEDISPDGWKSYCQLLDYAQEKGIPLLFKQVRPQIQSWDISQLDVTTFSAAQQHLTEKEKKELKSQLLANFEHLDTTLMNKLLEQLDMSDTDTLMNMPDNRFVFVMDRLLNIKGSYIHDPAATILRQRYVNIKVKTTALEEISNAASNDITDEIILRINYSGQRAHSLEEDINYCARNGLLTNAVNKHFQEAIKRKYRNISLLDYAKLMNMIGNCLTPDININQLSEIGQPSELKEQIDRLKKSGLTQVAEAIENRAQILTTQNLASNYEEVTKALEKKLDVKQLKGHTQQTLAQALDRPQQMTLVGYLNWLRLMKNKEQKLKDANLDELFNNTTKLLERTHALDWLMDSNNEETIIDALEEQPQVIEKLVKHLPKDDRNAFENNFAPYLHKSWFGKMANRIKSMDQRIIASFAVALVLFIGLSVFFWLREKEVAPQPTTTTVPIPTYLYITAKASQDTIANQGSCESASRHIMSFLSQWYMESYIKRSDSLTVSMQLVDSIDHPYIVIPAIGKLDSQQLWEIDSTYYQAVTPYINDSTFVHASVLTLNGDTLHIGRNNPLLKIAKEGGQHKVEKVVIDSIVMDINNNDFLKRNKYQRNLTHPVYVFWLVHQIDSCCRTNQIIKLFPY